MKLNKNRVCLKYRILGLCYRANKSQVRQAWQRLAKLYHPDHAKSDPEKTRILTERMSTINRAYEFIISNFDEIQDLYKTKLNKFTYTSKFPGKLKSHLVYKYVCNEVESDQRI